MNLLQRREVREGTARWSLYNITAALSGKATPRLPTLYKQYRPISTDAIEEKPASHKGVILHPACVSPPVSFSLHGTKPLLSPPFSTVRRWNTPRALHTSSPNYVDAPSQVHDVFESVTGSWQYIIADPATKAAVLIDPCLNYDPASCTVTTKSADSLLAIVKEQQYKVTMLLETHAHADHMSAASYLKKRLALEYPDLDLPVICIGKRIDSIQKRWAERYGIPQHSYEASFDRVFDDDEPFHVGELPGQAIHVPGHTPDHIAYRIGDCVFVGDTVFIEDLGSARADFPGGNVEDLWTSCRKILDLPESTKVYCGHDYPSLVSRTNPISYRTVGYHRKHNKHLRDGIEKEEFVRVRSARDRELVEPKLLHQSLQMNIRAGRLPPETGDNLRLLHIPLKSKTVW